MTFRTFDIKILNIFRQISLPLARFGLFVVFFWFGILKVFALSPANPLVGALLLRTMPIIPFDIFIVLFGIFECVIGILFLVKGAERIAILVLLIHMGMTVMPIVMLPHIAWSGFMIPTLEGQYIIKNVVIIATAIGIAAHLHPLHKGRYFN